jgi:hypothetical protein
MRRPHRVGRQSHFGLIPELLRKNNKPAILPRTDRYPAAKSNGRRHHEAVIMIRMLSDQVYAARSPIDMRIHSEPRAKLFRDTFPACHFRLSWSEGESSAWAKGFCTTDLLLPNYEAQFQKRFFWRRLWKRDVISLSWLYTTCT